MPYTNQVYDRPMARTNIDIDDELVKSRISLCSRSAANLTEDSGVLAVPITLAPASMS